MPDAPDRKTLANWRHHLQDEADAAFLYRRLAELETAPKKQDIYNRLADVEERHTAIWKTLFEEHGLRVSLKKPSLRARLLAWVGSRYSPDTLLTFLLREEGQEVKNYMDLYRSSAPGSPRKAARTLARESAEHAETLNSMADTEGEPWHQIESGGFMRNIIYGFNDGLTANFGLVAGVIGASVETHVILVTGIAGTLADALSMGSSGYLASKSEQEVYAHEIAMEKEEIRLMPEVEEEELALIYEARGIEAEKARQLASEVMSSPEQALEEKVREELKIGDPHTTPIREGWITGSATAIGAFIPVAPFLVLEGPTAMWTSFGVSMLSHFAVGA
ncbi:MAG: VIT1/CCC1 transporter family protein, partial [bacterium]|nr:VIT1/CCC1 transporter family protein [bacterium]